MALGRKPGGASTTTRRAVGPVATRARPAPPAKKQRRLRRHLKSTYPRRPAKNVASDGSAQEVAPEAPLFRSRAKASRGSQPTRHSTGAHRHHPR